MATPNLEDYLTSPNGEWVAVYEGEGVYLAPVADLGPDGLDEAPASALFSPNREHVNVAWSPDSSRVVLSHHAYLQEAGMPNEISILGIDGQHSVLVPQDDSVVQHRARWIGPDEVIYTRFAAGQTMTGPTRWWTVELGDEPKPVGTPDGADLQSSNFSMFAAGQIVGYAYPDFGTGADGFLEWGEQELFTLEPDGPLLRLLPGSAEDADEEPGEVVSIAPDAAVVSHGKLEIETSVGSDQGDHDARALVDLADGTRLPLQFGIVGDGIDGPIEAVLSPSGDQLAVLLRQRTDEGVFFLVEVCRTDDVWAAGGLNGASSTRVTLPHLPAESGGRSTPFLWVDPHVLLFETKRSLIRIDVSSGD